jgi:hypothetical protein
MEDNEFGVTQESEEAEKQKIMSEMVDNLEGYVRETRKYKEFEEDKKTELDKNLIPIQEDPDAKILVSVIQKYTDEESDLRLLMSGIKTDSIPFPLNELREKIEDTGLSRQDKINLLEETKSWFRITSQQLDQMPEVLGNARRGISGEFDQIRNGSDNIRLAREGTDRYFDQMRERTSDLDEYLGNSEVLWSQKLERAR